MLRELLRYLNSGQIVEIIYSDQSGRITQRQIKLYSIEGQTVKAYCFSRRAIRSFTVSNILAVMPILFKRGA